MSRGLYLKKDVVVWVVLEVISGETRPIKLWEASSWLSWELVSAAVSKPCQFLGLETQPSTGRLTTQDPLCQSILCDIFTIECHLRKTAAQI